MSDLVRPCKTTIQLPTFRSGELAYPHLGPDMDGKKTFVELNAVARLSFWKRLELLFCDRIECRFKMVVRTEDGTTVATFAYYIK